MTKNARVQRENGLGDFIARTYGVRIEQIDTSSKVKRQLAKVGVKGVEADEYVWRVVQDTIEHFQATIPSEGYEREYALDAVFRYYKDNGYITPPMKIDGPDYFENGFVVSTVFFNQERCPKCLRT